MFKKNNTAKSNGLPLMGAAALAALPLGPVASEELEEVVVTALKREQSLLETADSISVFNEATIQKAGIERPGDFVAMIPNAALIDSNVEGEAFLVLRGMAPARNAETSTAIVVDGVLSIGPNELNQDLFDVQQIEVLKGPQSALYGRNAVGGVVVITTKRPGNEFEGHVKVGSGEENRKLAQLSISSPLIADRLFLRAAASHNERDGKLTNIITGEDRDRFQRKNARLRLDWQATENLLVDFRSGVSRLRDAGGIQFTASTLPDMLDINNVFPPFENNIKSFNDQDKENASLKIDWETPYGTLTSVSAYSSVEDRYGQDNFPYIFDDFGFDEDGNFRGGLTQWVLFNTEGISQELRWTSPAEARFSYILGVYLADIEADRVTNLAEDRASILLNGRRPNPADSINPTVVFRDDETERDTTAFFAHLAFDITDTLAATAAVRYDNEEAEVRDLAPAAWSATPGLKRDDEYSDTTTKLTLNWALSDNVSVSASYGEAFKAGGFNPSGTAAAVAAANPLSTVQDEYGEETSDSIDLGIKAELFAKRLFLSAAIFRTEAENFQVFEFFPGPSLQAIAQVEEVEIDGFEIEATWRVNDNFTLQAAYGETESTVEKLLSNPALRGNRMPYTPEDTFFLSAEHIWQFGGNGMQLSARVDYNRVGETYWDLLNTPGSVRDPVDLVEARLTLAGDSWDTTLWVSNALDEEYYGEVVVIFPGPVVDPAFAIAAAASSPAAPRYWGIDFTYRF